MTEKQPGFSAEHRADNDNRKSKPGPSIVSAVSPTPARASYRKRWNAVQLSKATIAWLCLAMIVATMIVGFTWGGWVTAATSQQTAKVVANDAVVQRLSAICVAQFQQDADKETKLAEFQAATSYEQRNYVRDQGWATMPGEEESDTKVATACAKALAQVTTE
ncbi:MAG: hypothetical protein KDE31_01090 [Caldilineaceae bacterium]|nr:hypothetical protein [Caldilineaceae bacterium]